MIYDNNNWRSPSRQVETSVELYRGSTLVDTYTKRKSIINYKIDRVAPEGKFFGFGISHKMTLNLIDINRAIDIKKDDGLDVYIGTNGTQISSIPTVYVDEATRDENTNSLTITAYDKLSDASKYTFADLGLSAPYNLWEVLDGICSILKFRGGIGIHNESEAPIIDILNTTYPDGANLDGTETLREILDAIAEITQSIYYLSNGDCLTFKHLNYAYNDITVKIDKNTYFTLSTEQARTLTSICSATELGDNLTASTGADGEIQYIRDNPFMELRADLAQMLDNAIAEIGGLTITPYSCLWRGNFSLEPGDEIEIVTKDNEIITTFLLNDTIEFNGGLKQISNWSYKESAQTASNPTTLGEVIKQTYAKVDKANKEIEIVAGETATIKMTTDSIEASVTQIDNTVNDLSLELNTKATPEDVTISIERVMKQGVESVTTATGFTFNEDGLHINKTDSEITTTITEDGMIINKDTTEVLRADNEGVKAIDLHATTYLIIGKNSRFEDYNSNRTGCFWIGG